MSTAITIKEIEWGARYSFRTGETQEGIRGWVRLPDGSVEPVVIQALNEPYDTTRERVLAEAERVYGDR